MVKFHSVRHSASSSMIAAGIQLPDVAVRMGHSRKMLMSTCLHASTSQRSVTEQYTASLAAGFKLAQTSGDEA